MGLIQSQESFKCRKERQESEPEMSVSEDVNELPLLDSRMQEGLTG